MFTGMLAAVATFVLATLLVQFWTEVSVTLKKAFAWLRRSQVGTTYSLLVAACTLSVCRAVSLLALTSQQMVQVWM